MKQELTRSATSSPARWVLPALPGAGTRRGGEIPRAECWRCECRRRSRRTGVAEPVLRRRGSIEVLLTDIRPIRHTILANIEKGALCADDGGDSVRFHDVLNQVLAIEILDVSQSSRHHSVAESLNEPMASLRFLACAPEDIAFAESVANRIQ